MKKILFTLALLISFSSFGQDDIKQGLVIQYYESGEVESKVNYVDGKEQGEYIEYYESGEVKLKVNYVDGQLQGEVIIYYESGAVEGKGNLVDGKEQGERIDYYENGLVKEKLNFVDGMLVEVKESYEDGEEFLKETKGMFEVRGKVTDYWGDYNSMALFLVEDSIEKSLIGTEISILVMPLSDLDCESWNDFEKTYEEKKGKDYYLYSNIENCEGCSFQLFIKKIEFSCIEENGELGKKEEAWGSVISLKVEK